MANKTDRIACTEVNKGLLGSFWGQPKGTGARSEMSVKLTSFQRDKQYHRANKAPVRINSFAPGRWPYCQSTVKEASIDGIKVTQRWQ
ncbi:hypothetical protein P4S72_18145 [Vibrio sp. PP-XX7]